MPVAVFAFFRHADDHAEGIRQVILCVGDTDTVAAIAGAMIGARVGVSVSSGTMFATDREESLVATLTIEVTDETYARLQQRALAIGSTPEAIASADVARLSPPKPGELLRPWIGSIDLGVSDAGINHDRYIGDALVDEHRGPAR